MVEEECKKVGLTVHRIELPASMISVEDRMATTEAMIRECQGLELDGLPLWKILALDDFVGSLMLHKAQPETWFDADVVLMPLMAVDNNSREGCGLYGWAQARAKERGVPIVGFEVGPIGNKHTMAHLAMDVFAVKSLRAKDYLVRHGAARPDRVFVLTHEEAYLTYPGTAQYEDAFLEKDVALRQKLNLQSGGLTAFLPHHVAFQYEARKIIEALAGVPDLANLIIRVDNRTTRRQHTEQDIVLRCYGPAIRKLKHVVICDETVGVGLLTHVADFIVTGNAGMVTERAGYVRKPTIICQAFREPEAEPENNRVAVPDAKMIPQIVQAWRDLGLFGAKSIAELTQMAFDLGADAEAKSPKITQHPAPQLPFQIAHVPGGQAQLPGA